MTKSLNDPIALPWRPGQRASADQVNVQMKNGLSRAWSHVEHGAISVLDRTVARNLCRRQVAAPYQLRVFGRGLFEAGNVSFRDDQHVRRSLRIQIFKSKRVFVFKDFFGWHFAANNPTE